MISNCVKIYSFVILAQFENHAIFVSYGERKKASESTLQFMCLEFGIKGIVAKNWFKLFSELFDVVWQLFVFSSKLGGIDNLHSGDYRKSLRERRVFP